MFVLNSLLKLQSEKSFYPKLDIAKLYKILTTEHQLTMMNPSLLGAVTDDSSVWDRQREEKKKLEKAERAKNECKCPACDKKV